MKKLFLALLLVVLGAVRSYGQTKPEVRIPAFEDKYCTYIAQLEAGQTDIDYQDFRFSFIESKQFAVASARSSDFDSLKKEMYAQMEKSNYQEVIKITTQMLSIDYTSMLAHKILRQTYAIVGDTLHAAQYKAIQFGLLYSIVQQGDGKTCATAWPVIQIEEEYFILGVIDAKLQQQSISYDGGVCDKMDVLVDGIEKTYYFEVSKVFEGYTKSGLK